MIIELRTNLATGAFVKFSASDEEHYLSAKLKTWTESSTNRVNLMDQLLRYGCTLINTSVWTSAPAVAEHFVTNQGGEIVDTFYAEEEEGDGLNEMMALRSRMAKDVPFKL